MTTGTPDQITVVIIDDDPFVCGSLRTILEAQPDITVLAVGHDGAAAESLYRQHRPDILLTDIQMPGRTGLEAAAAILVEDAAARIVLLTTFSDDQYIVQALRLGAKGYLIKQDVATIAPALRLVMAGQSVLGEEVMGRVDQLIAGGSRRIEGPGGGVDNVEGMDQSDFVAESEPGSGRTAPVGLIIPAGSDRTIFAGTTSPAGSDMQARLTQRENEVTELVAQGLDNRQIAARLFISEGTTRNLISTILQKLNLKNRTQLAITYYRGQSDNF